MFPPRRYKLDSATIVDRLNNIYTYPVKTCYGRTEPVTVGKPSPICVEASEEIVRLRALLDEIGVKYL